MTLTAAGHRLNVMAAVFPLGSFTGYDFSEDGIGPDEPRPRNWSSQTRASSCWTSPSWTGADAFDVIIGFDAIHDARASSSLENNLSHPVGPLLYLWSLMHCMPLSLAQNGEGLGAAWGEERALEYLATAGFPSVEVKSQRATSSIVCTCARRISSLRAR